LFRSFHRLRSPLARFRSFHSPGSVHFIHPVPFISFTRFRSFHSPGSFHSHTLHRFARFKVRSSPLIRHFTGFARSFHFIPFTRFTDSLASRFVPHRLFAISPASLVHSISFHSHASPIRSLHGSFLTARSLIDTNSNSSSYHHSPASPACPRLHLSPQTGTTPSATCPSQTAGCPA